MKGYQRLQTSARPTDVNKPCVFLPFFFFSFSSWKQQPRQYDGKPRHEDVPTSSRLTYSFDRHVNSDVILMLTHENFKHIRNLIYTYIRIWQWYGILNFYSISLVRKINIVKWRRYERESVKVRQHLRLTKCQQSQHKRKLKKKTTKGQNFLRVKCFNKTSVSFEYSSGWWQVRTTVRDIVAPYYPGSPVQLPTRSCTGTY